MFWNSALIAPVMMICIYFGIPASPARKKDSPAPSFVGFLYLSAGLAKLFTAIQQGERLDWWRSLISGNGTPYCSASSCFGFGLLSPEPSY
jgi:DHA2 family multidrug resistance protein